MNNEEIKMNNEKLEVRKYFSLLTLYSSLFTLLFSFTAYAQTTALSANENYIYSKNCLNEDCSRKIETVEYSDGLGRAKQVVGIKASPSGKDVVTPIEYDLFGRQVKSYLPIPQTGTQNGAVYTNPKSNAVQSYGTDTFFYSDIALENSPAPKVLSRTRPGAEFQGRSVVYDYRVNATGDVKKYTVTTSWVNGATQNALTQSGNYPAGQLVKTSVTDEDNNTSIEFTNGKGQTILVRKVISSTQNADTYYVYNKYGQLVYTIPPLAVTATLNQATLDNLCYQYKYDVKGRQVEKKLPGKGWEYLVYDPADRLVMTQDAEMRKTGKWFFTKYDKLSRVVYTGIADIGAQFIRQQVQYSTDYYISQGKPSNEERNATGFTNSGMVIYYGNTVYPTTIDKVLSTNYYDSYPTGTPTRPTQIFGKNTISDNAAAAINTKNLPTASYVKNIEDDNWTKTYVWYDGKSRSIGSHSVNHLNGYTKTETELDFAGAVLRSKAYHKRLSADTERIITQTYEYDPLNRLKKQWHQVDSQPQELLVENTYNELSQLSNKKVGNNLQSLDYTYAVRGSLTRVNNPASLGTKLFGYELRYQNPSYTSLSGARYNGSISEVTWKTASDQVLRRYSYQYDALNRLQKGTYTEPNSSVPQNNFYNEAAAYDLNGNITSLQRNSKGTTGAAELIDNLNYSYTGNRLNTVTDSSANYGGYPDVSGNAISYDDNGNMTNHIDKGILQIDYNHLSLPKYIKFDQTYIIRNPVTQQDEERNIRTNYTYRADGTKLRKTYTVFNARSSTERVTTTDYLDGFQYTVNYVNAVSLDFVPTSEGYYDFKNNKYIYNYTDHLGNIRVSYAKSSTGGAEIIRENNYYPFGLKQESNILSLSTYNYGYNGKELQTETGWNDYGARMYMADIGRWGVIDPLAETSRKYSPYNYALDNPISFIDPDGRRAMAPDPWVWNQSLSGALGYMMGGGSATFGSFAEFLGQGSPFSQLNSNSGSGGGGGGLSSAAIDNMFNIGGLWTNTGGGFTNSSNVSIGYNGSYQSLNTALDGYINIPEVVLSGSSSGWGGQIQSSFNGFMGQWNSQTNNYWGLLNNASTAQSYTVNGIGFTLGTTAQVSNDLVDAGKMIKTSNVFKTYNLYRSNGYLNGNKYISGVKFMKNVKAINALNNSKVVKGIGYAGLMISAEQFRESHHPGYISRGIVSFLSGFIPYAGPAVSLGVDNTNVNYWNIWTWGAMERGSNKYDYLNP